MIGIMVKAGHPIDDDDDLIKESAAMIGIMVKAGHPIEKLNREKRKIRPSLRSPRKSKREEK